MKALALLDPFSDNVLENFLAILFEVLLKLFVVTNHQVGDVNHLDQTLHQ